MLNQLLLHQDKKEGIEEADINDVLNFILSNLI